MKKETKTLLKVLGVILAILVILYYLINIVYVPTPDPVEFPQGALSDSLFTAQNNKYTENEALPQNHVFETVPYSVDVPEGDPAHIGSGTVYRASDTHFVYVSEYSDSDVSNTVDGVHEIIGTQFPAALLVDYVPEKTQVVKQVDKQGYINGFSAQYVVDTIRVANAKDTVEAAVLGYRLDMPSELHKGIYAGKNILVCMATTDISTENLANCDAMLAVIVGTVHDDDRFISPDDKEKLTEMEKAEQEQKEAEAEETEEKETPSETVESDITSLYVDVTAEYTLLSIDVSWANANNDVVFRLYTPDGSTWYEPAVQTETSARFNISSAPTGMYSVEIEGYKALGAINTSQSGTLAVNSSSGGGVTTGPAASPADDDSDGDSGEAGEPTVDEVIYE